MISANLYFKARLSLVSIALLGTLSLTAQDLIAYEIPELTDHNGDRPSLRSSARSVSEILQGNVFIQDSLNIGLETGATGYRLAVDGKIMCEELKVESSATWPDYVFSKDYDLLTLADVEQFILKHQHLPGIPSAADVESNGVHVGALQARLLEKIEELTLHIIAQDKRIASLEMAAQGKKPGKAVDPTSKRR